MIRYRGSRVDGRGQGWRRVARRGEGPVVRSFWNWSPVAAACRPALGDSLQAEVEAALEAVTLPDSLAGGWARGWEEPARRGGDMGRIGWEGGGGS